MVHEIVLYGSGKRCKVLCEILQQSNIKIIAIVDSSPNKWGNKVEGFEVENPDIIQNMSYKNICITVADIEAVTEIRRILVNKYEYDLKNEIHFNRLILEAYMQCPMLTKKIMGIKTSSNKENILFDCFNGLGLGGVEEWTMELCKTLLEDGKKSTYIISDVGAYLVPFLLKNHIIYVDINHQEQFSISTILNLIEAIMPKMPCKIITCTTNEVMLAAYLIKRCYPDEIEIISVIHNSNDNVYKEYHDFKECPDIYISVSKDIQDNMIQLGIKPDHIYSMTCPFACDPALRRTYSENELQPVRIGYAGRIEYHQKRMDLWLSLISILVEKNINFRIDFAGDGAARKEMEEIINDNHWGDKVRFCGRLKRSELSYFWKRQDICVNLADFEGRSISILEAMGNGAVPVVTKTSGVREDITDNINGCIVPIGDYQAVAERIEYLSRHRNQLCKMGKSAHDAVYPKSMMKPHFEFWKGILFRSRISGTDKTANRRRN